MPATVVTESVLDAPADDVWALLQLPATFAYVVHPLFTLPALANHRGPFAVGDGGAGWLLLLGVVPLYRHRIELAALDPAARTIETREGGGMLRQWDHTLEVAPVDAGRCRYRDTIVLDAGLLTPVAARIVRAIFAHRHRRWRRLVAARPT